MDISLINSYNEQDSSCHRIDARAKFIFTLLFILCIILTPPDNWSAYIAYFITIISLISLARLPGRYVLKRSLIVMPFVLMLAIFIPFFKEGEIAGSYNIRSWNLTVTYDGIQVMTNLLIKAWLSMLGLIWLTSTTKTNDLFHALGRLHLPQVLVMILSFMYRYIFVIIDEMMRMKQARDSRNFGGGKLWQLRTIGNMIGTLFIRSYERSERVYAAMISRGFDGQTRTLDNLNFRRSDIFFIITLVIILAAINIVNLLVLN